MKPTDAHILRFYLLFATVNLLGVYYGDKEIESFSKIILMPVLFRYVHVHRIDYGPLARTLQAALLFSWIGDIALIFQNTYPNAFLAGLGSFLIGHIFYIILNLKAVSNQTKGNLLTPIIITLVLVAYGVILVMRLYPGLESYTIPVTVYAIVILIMGITAAWRWGKTDRSSYLMVLSGAITFIASDSLIAINKFYYSFENSGVAIMATYIIAQYLLVKGFRMHK